MVTNKKVKTITTAVQQSVSNGLSGFAPERIPHANQELPKNYPDRSLLRESQLEYDFSLLSTLSIAAKILFTSFAGKRENDTNEQHEFNIASFVADLLKDTRQICQYSLYIRKNLETRNKDFASDIETRIGKFAFGRTIYRLNVLLAPWLTLIRPLLHPSRSLIWGAPLRFLDFVDNSITRITNMFWQRRRILFGILPYRGFTSESELRSKQLELGAFMKSILDLLPFKTPRQLYHKIFWGHENFLDHNIPNTSLRDPAMLGQQFLRDNFENIRKIFQKNLSPELKVESQDDHHLYTRFKYLSRFIGLWTGIGGFALNAGSIVIDFFAKLFNSTNFAYKGLVWNRFANALIALPYLLGEVPTLFHQVYKKFKATQTLDREGLFIAGTGVLAMLHKMRVLPVVSHVLRFFGIHSFMERWSEQLEDLILLFFSHARLRINREELGVAHEAASGLEQRLQQQSMSPARFFTLPIRAFFRDPKLETKF